MMDNGENEMNGDYLDFCEKRLKSCSLAEQRVSKIDAGMLDIGELTVSLAAFACRARVSCELWAPQRGANLSMALRP